MTITQSDTPDQTSHAHVGSWTGFLVAIVSVFCLDQVTKLWALAELVQGQSVPIIEGLFNLSLTFNRGVAFGLFSGLPELPRVIVLSLATLLAFSVVLYLLLKDYRTDRVARIALGLVVGGAFGNLLDRARLGEVVDFFDVYYSQYHWPAFNVADSGICVGVIFLLLRRPGR